jgi:hypothetical protein
MNTGRENKMPWRVFAGVFLLLISFSVLQAAQAETADHVLINEIQTDSILGAGGSSDDWIELYNPGTSEVILDGWSIQKQSALANSTIYKKTLSGTIPAKGHFLIVRGDTATAQTLKDMADVLTAATFSIASDNVVYLVANDINIETASDPDIVDMVGFGTVESFEGTAPALNPAETKSLVRLPLGEDTNDNTFDFEISSSPSPENKISGTVLPEPENDNALSAEVLITLTLDPEPVRNISAQAANIYFSVNGAAKAWVEYGTSADYGLSSEHISVSPDQVNQIALTDLLCGSEYHYSVVAETLDASDSHRSLDGVFQTLPCGISLDSLTMTRSGARANASYAEGWHWEFALTVWDTNETRLKMKFDPWLGLGTLSAAGNMQYSADGSVWQSISLDSAYGAEAIDIASIDEDPLRAGRQLKLRVQMRVPQGTKMGTYTSAYGILSEKPLN